MKNILSIFFLSLFFLLLNKIHYSQPIGINLLWEKEAQVRTMKFTPGGELLVTGGKSDGCGQYKCGQIKVWSVADSSLLHTIDGYSIGLTNDLDISSDGQKIISAHGSVYCSAFSGCTRDRAGQFEFTINGSQLFANTNPDGIIYSVAFSPDENMIAAGTGYNNSGHINIYDSNYNLLRTLLGHSGNTWSLLFTPDGQYLISGGYDGYIRMWNPHNGSFIRFMQHGNLTNGGTNVKLAVSPDGQYLASAGRGYNMVVKIWKISDGTLVQTLPVDVQHDGGGDSYIEFSPNGIYLVNGLALYTSGGIGWHGRIRFYEVSSGDLVREYIDSLGSPYDGGLRDIALSPTGNNYFAYSVGTGSNNKLRLATTDLSLAENASTPVELSSFTASVNNKSIMLNWITSSELNNSGFEIERIAQSAESMAWETIVFIPGSGTTTEPKEYSFTDNLDLEHEPELIKYRLKQIDFDGSFEYSKEIEVEIKSLPTQFALYQNYPNPFNPATKIKYAVPFSLSSKERDGVRSFVTLKIYDILGNQVATLVSEAKEPGEYVAEFNAGQLTSGVYFYTLQAGEFTATKKLLLMK